MYQKLPKPRANKLFQKARSLRLAKLSGQGFTLIELLIVTAILSILLIIVLARFGTFGGQVDLNTSSQRILSTLQRARNQTLASEDDAAVGATYGVHFETSKYVLFQGSTYDSLDTNNKEYDLSTTTVSDISILPVVGTDVDVVFDRVRGTTSNSGSVTLQLVADTSKTQTILISAFGQVSLQQTLSPTSDTRVFDTRHVHLVFLSGTSMLNSNTMQLIFSDPPGPVVTKDIDIPTFTAGSKFDWEDSVDVNGDQELRIHTHLLNSTDTTLSVHRDLRKNDKALRIEIDGTTIVTYTDLGVVTPGFIDQLIVQ